jgi:hypothetical protein
MVQAAVMLDPRLNVPLLTVMLVLLARTMPNVLVVALVAATELK